MTTNQIIFGAGCFWGVEAAFRQLVGVTDAVCGYSGGTMDNQSYEAVCSGTTGHAEVVLVKYDPACLTLETLLDCFWDCHNPTTRNRQGPDIGTQYRSAIYFYSPEQEVIAQQSRDRLQFSGRWQDPVVTEILPAGTFFRAEEYHQNYFSKRKLIDYR